MANVVAIDVTVACPAEIVRIHSVRCVNTYRIGTHEETVGIKLIACLVAIVMEADLGIVSREDEVIAVVVCNERVLMAIIKGVEQTVGVFFRLVKPKDVVLILVAQTVPEESHCAIGIGKDKTPKVAGEELRACSQRYKVVVRAGVCNLGFIEPFLEGPEGSVTVGAIGYIRRHNSQFVDLQVVLIEDHVGFDPPIKWTKDRVAFK